MHRSDGRRVSPRVFGDPSRWLIAYRGGRWTVHPPVGTFWGRSSTHETGDQARAAYLQEIAHTGTGAQAA
ncbi:hypothetical protein I5H06_gp39 [Mycobacterium phage SirPhilip]|uniref:Uncharacterized protein n=1 Tax=Mycobacterium phage SirPhilip TaxID=2015824 RepID=A0A222ZLI7_9CAUD|nr:hypothetical protein I5H06_gp39 [Mycobacterium phage SirPhilip]ASR85265.1 hypothetical protein SEA_SIRPHILIP_63 [Mycobacterium phage SirPhilip]